MWLLLLMVLLLVVEARATNASRTLCELEWKESERVRGKKPPVRLANGERYPPVVFWGVLVDRKLIS